MTKRQAEKHKAYRELHRHGLDFAKFNHIAPNSGSETFAHIVAKAAVLHVGVNNDYWVASEVETPHGEIDVLLYGNPERSTYAVEVESSPTQDVKQDKLNRYVRKQSGVDDMVLINITEMPSQFVEALGYVANELGLVE